MQVPLICVSHLADPGSNPGHIINNLHNLIDTTIGENNVY